MHFLRLCTLSVLAAVSTSRALYPRVDLVCDDDDYDVDEVGDLAEDLDILEVNDGPTADRRAGVGVEFESPFFILTSSECSLEDTHAARKKIIASRHGENFMLTADTGNEPGRLHGEYILDGTRIKVGTGDAARAGRAARDDFKPWAADEPGSVTIEDNKCTWRLESPSAKDDPARLPWQPQVTAPMPLEAVYTLMKDVHKERQGVLVGHAGKKQSILHLVERSFFVASPNGISRNDVTDDVLAFCTLVLSYARAAQTPLKPNQSPKLNFEFMPRTDFNALFRQVESKIPGDLFELFNTLACYKRVMTKKKKINLVIDKEFCDGEKIAEPPIPGNKFGELMYENHATNPPTIMSIKEWIQGISAGSNSPDLLSIFDQSIDGSIGGLGGAMERMHNSERLVPLFEFRSLNTLDTTEFEGFMQMVDSEIQDLHERYT